MTARLDAIGIVVADMERSLAFYRRLGLDIPTDAASEDHVEAQLPGGLRVMWDTEATIRSFDPNWTAPQGSPRVVLAFACESAADVNRLYAELTEAGYAGQREPWDAFWGQRYATVGDPDGNAVDLFAELTGRGSGQDSAGSHGSSQG
jgi:catechol 2,3-dioxygenase-like lactoylglutathione lyase family enzyme